MTTQLQSTQSHVDSGDPGRHQIQPREIARFLEWLARRCDTDIISQPERLRATADAASVAVWVHLAELTADLNQVRVYDAISLLAMAMVRRFEDVDPGISERVISEQRAAHRVAGFPLSQ